MKKSCHAAIDRAWNGEIIEPGAKQDGYFSCGIGERGMNSII
jgi:hypothetical protein